MNGIGNPLVLTSMALASVSLAKEKNFIKENWKPILGIGATLGVTYVIWNIYSDWKNEPTSGGLDENNNFPESVLTQSQAMVKADRLYNAMRSFGNPNEEELQEIMSVLQNMNYNDFVKISKAFGERRYVTATGVGGIWPADLRNLVFWLTNELPSSELNSLRQILPNSF